jgi:hypothetical protein
MSTDPRWTDETAAALVRELGYFLIQEGALHRFDDFAAHVLDALADLGVLVPPGGEVREAALAVDAAWRGDGHGGRVVGPLRALESAADIYQKGPETAPGATQAGDSPGGSQ